MKYTVKDLVDVDQLKRDSAINTADLSSAMMQQTSLLVHYGVLAAQASKQVDNVSMLLKNAEAAAYRQFRDEAAGKGEKVTEAQLEKLVLRAPNVIQMMRALNEAKQIEAIAKIAVESFRHRRDMLIQLGANERKEMEGEIAVYRGRAREVEAEDNKNTVLAMASGHNP